MMSMTSQQSKAFALIREANQHGTAPSFEELREHLGIASKAGVHRIVCALEERGAIRRMPGRVRALEAVEVGPLDGRSTAELLAMRDRIDRVLAGRSQ